MSEPRSPDTILQEAQPFFRRNRGPVAAGLALLVILAMGITGTTIGLAKSRQALAEAQEERNEKERLAERLKSERDEKSRTAAKLEVERDAKETLLEETARLLAEKGNLLEEKRTLLALAEKRERAAMKARKETEASLAREQEISADLKKKELELQTALNEKQDALKRYEEAEARANLEKKRVEETQKEMDERLAEMDERLAEQFPDLNFVKLQLENAHLAAQPLTLDETSKLLDLAAITLDRSFVTLLGFADLVPDFSVAEKFLEDLDLPFGEFPSTYSIRGAAAAQDVPLGTWKHWHPTTREGIEYLPLSDLGSLYGLVAAPGLLHSEVDSSHVLFDKEGRTMINEVRFRLREPTIEVDGQRAVSRRDVEELIDPVLRPHLVKTSRGSRKVAVNLRDPGDPYLYQVATEFVRELEMRGFEVSHCEDSHLGDLDERTVVIAMGVGDPNENGELVGTYRTRLAAPGNLLGGEQPEKARSTGQIRADVLLAAAVHSNLLRLALQDLGVSWAEDPVLQRAPGPAILVEVGPPTFDQDAQSADEEESLGTAPSEVAKRIASGLMAHLLRTNSPQRKPGAVEETQQRKGRGEKLSPALKSLQESHEAEKELIEPENTGDEK